MDLNELGYNVTSYIHQLHQAKMEAYISGDHTLYKQAKNTLTREIREAKRRHYEKLKSKFLASTALRICEEDVCRLFQRLKNWKAPGTEGVSPSILRTCADQLTLIFT